MGHVRHMALESGHPVLVVRPACPELIYQSAAAAGDASDPMPPTDKLSFVDYGTVPGARAGGYELVFDPLQFFDAEAAIVAFKPDVMLVMDPDQFMFDALRLPGFNSLVLNLSRPEPPPVTIACFTTFNVDAVLNMLDFWWMPQWARPILDAGVATSYGHFDHTFVNGEPTKEYLQLQTVHVRPPDEPFNLGDRVRVVSGRGVPPAFCAEPPQSECDALRAASLVRDRQPSDSVALVYVGRLAFDKSVDEMLGAYVKALKQLSWPAATFYIVGSGELEGTVREIERKHPQHIKYLGALAHKHVSCVLRDATAYVSGAPNETYGRAMVEGLHCGLPVVAMKSCNLHVTSEVNGLLAGDSDELVRHLVRVLSEPQLVQKLAANTIGGQQRSGERGDGAHEPNRRMLAAVVEAHAATTNGGGPGARRRPWGPRPYHWLWTRLLGISRLLDAPPSLLAVSGAVLGVLLGLVVCVWTCCCRRRGAPATAHAPATTRKKRD